MNQINNRINTFLTDDGECLKVHISGSGMPVVMLHGWTASHLDWNPLLSTLNSKFRVFCPDARSHGGQVLSTTVNPDVKRLARDLLNLLDFYELKKVDVVGHSMGALTIWQFIQDYGCERFSRICIIDQSPKLVTDDTWKHGIYGNFDEDHSKRMLADFNTNFSESVLKLIAHGLNSKARDSYDRDSKGWKLARQNLQRLCPKPLISIWESLVASDYRNILSHINVPTLIVWGMESNFYTQATAKYLIDHIQDVTLSLYENADHCPQAKDPERFSNELLEFFGGVNVRSIRLDADNHFTRIL